MKRRKTMLVTVLILVACTAVLGSGKQAGSKPTVNSAPEVPGFSERNPRYILRAEDAFDITFEFNPELNQTVTVQPDGFIAIRPLGDFHVEGMTIPQLTKQLETAFAKIVQHPSLSINLKDFEKPYFIASGHVARPGKYDLRGDTTVSQAIAIAGGFQEGAKSSQVLLLRRVSDQWFQTKIINIKHLEKGKDLQEDVHLHPGDMLFVPKSRFGKIEPYIPRANVFMSPTQF